MYLEVSVMSNKLLIGAGWVLCVAGCASNPSIPGATPHEAAAASSVPQALCATSTAARISPSSRECAVFGHSWTQEDIRSTGATDAGRALDLLDPTITVR
jgi:hypothetical protein